MLKKSMTIGIIACMTCINIIPLSSGITVDNESKTLNFLMGLVINPEFENNTVRCLAIRLRWYKISSIGNRSGGISFLDWVIFDRNVLFREWGKIHFVFKIYYGYFEFDNE
ncbi:MAG: hypothetical protein JSW06_10140 [Thermoplasmatales archaeon]|nr:MAG: hypothetical protein JSW06_10140 [Thermoplasmatales archaeon]